jgi:hypothetical protein
MRCLRRHWLGLLLIGVAGALAPLVALLFLGELTVLSINPVTGEYRLRIRAGLEDVGGYERCLSTELALQASMQKEKGYWLWLDSELRLPGGSVLASGQGQIKQLQGFIDAVSLTSMLRYPARSVEVKAGQRRVTQRPAQYDPAASDELVRQALEIVEQTRDLKLAQRYLEQTASRQRRSTGPPLALEAVPDAGEFMQTGRLIVSAPAPVVNPPQITGGH